jgi:hypothetical protein
MANPPKQKGTGGEREVVLELRMRGIDAVREPASAAWDITVRGSTGRTINALATRPDHGRWLVTIPFEDFAHILAEHGDNAHIEVKRYARFALHTIFGKKFPGNGKPRPK